MANTPKKQAPREGKDLGTVTKADLTKSTKKRIKAVLFIPHGESVQSDMDIQVVSVHKPTMAAIAMRRC